MKPIWRLHGPGKHQHHDLENLNDIPHVTLTPRCLPEKDYKRSIFRIFLEYLVLLCLKFTLCGKCRSYWVIRKQLLV